MPKPKAVATVPPELDQYVGTKKLKVLQGRQRDAVLGMLHQGVMSVEEAGAEVNRLVDGTFKCKYLGSVPVGAAKLSKAMWSMFGDEVISTAFPRIKALKRKALDVVLCCAPLGIRVFEAGGEGGVLEDEPMDQVQYVGVDSTDKKRFAYLTHYSRLGLIFCHMFAKPKNDDVVGVLRGLVEAKQREMAELSGADDRAAEAEGAEKTTGGTVGIFEVLLMGSVPLRQFRLRRSSAPDAKAANYRKYQTAVKSALQELGAESKSGGGGRDDRLKTTPVVFVVSSEGIRVVETASRDMRARMFIEMIEFTTEIVGVKKGCIFALVVKEKRSDQSRRICHVFRVGPDESEKICAALGVAKQQATEDLQAREGNPFLASTKLTERVPPAFEPLELPRKGLTPMLALGAGEFGQVYLAKQELGDGTTKQRAVKMLRGGAAASDKELFCREISINARLKHANIVEVVGTCMSSRPYLVVLELCRYGDLHGLLIACKAKKLKVRYNEQLSWGVQLASALGYMSSKRFVHLDVAARNVFVDAGHRLRLGDFGLAQPYETGKSYYLMRKSTRLSIRWLAVEICGPPPKLVSAASDVWSFGVTLWEIMTYARRRPFHRHGLKDVARLVSHGGRLSKPSGCPAPLWAVMEQCWIADPTARPTCTQIVKDLTAMMVAEGGEIRDVAKLVNEAIEAESKAPDTSEDPAEAAEPEEPEDAGPASALTALGDGGRESVALNKTEWDELTVLLDAFDN